MRGLFWKDVLYLKNMWKMVLTSGLFIVVFYILNPNNFNSVIFIAIIFGGNFSIIPFTYDNYSKWNTYQYAFPVSKKIVVCSRYLFGLTLFSICLLLSIFSMLLTEIEYLLFCSDVPPFTLQYVSSELLPIFLIPIMQAISFPLMYRFGAEKGRIYILCFVAAIIALISIITIGMGYQIENFSVSYFEMLIGVMGTAIIMYLLSLLLSIQIEQKKKI